MKKPFYVDVMVIGYINVTVAAHSMEDIDDSEATEKALEAFQRDPGELHNCEFEVVQIEQGEHEPLIGED